MTVVREKTEIDRAPHNGSPANELATALERERKKNRRLIARLQEAEKMLMDANRSYADAQQRRAQRGI